jgi:hypothetical protein
MTFSKPGAPGEPQRTGVAIGTTFPLHALLVTVAAERGLTAQEALEPRLVEVPAHQAVTSLISGAIDVAVIDIAGFVGERSLGWDGLAIAAFGPVAEDRSVALAVVEAATWTRRRDTCERLVRAWTRALMLLRSGSAVEPRAQASEIESWWSDCRPDGDELSNVARWEPGETTAALVEGLAWLSSGTITEPPS